MAVTVLIGICALLIALSIIAVIVAGVRGAFIKQMEIQKLGTIVIAIIAFIVAYLVLGGVVRAALIALIVMLIISIIAIIFTGARGAFTGSL
jgi:hypothetical protein